MNKSIKNQHLITSCSSCGKGFRPDNISLISRERSKALFHVTCPHCKTAALITISAILQGTVNLITVTDLSRQEIREKFFSEKVSNDEILDAYEILSGSL